MRLLTVSTAEMVCYAAVHGLLALTNAGMLVNGTFM